jgi:hypothetical protein
MLVAASGPGMQKAQPEPESEAPSHCLRGTDCVERKSQAASALQVDGRRALARSGDGELPAAAARGPGGCFAQAASRTRTDPFIDCPIHLEPR